MERERSGVLLQMGRSRIHLVGLDKLQVMRYRWEENRHSNAQWELHCVLQGACRVDLETGSVPISAGQAILIPPGQYHRPRTESGAFERLSLVFFLEGDLLSRLRQRCSGSVLVSLDKVLLPLAEEILREHENRRAFRQLCLESMLARFMVGVFRDLELSEDDADTNVPFDRQITSEIDAYFEKHFADTAGESVLAERLHISRRQLVRVLHTHYGMNFREKLINTRMDYAAWLLRTTAQPVSQICQQVGYSSEAAFFKIFRRHFGVTPSNYRAENI